MEAGDGHLLLAGGGREDGPEPLLGGEQVGMRVNSRCLGELGAAPSSVSLTGRGVDEVVAGGRAAVVGEPGGFGERLGVAVGAMLLEQ
jgi:hypothetical protein